VKQFLSDTRDFLSKMIRTGNVTQKVMADLDIVTDFSYAWELIREFTPLMYDRIKKNPGVVLLLRATFLKLSSILSLPLVRITQCESKDDVSVAEYYSSELVLYVRKVTQTSIT
jgi:WASH complex subunit strumpellin